MFLVPGPPALDDQPFPAVRRQRADDRRLLPTHRCFQPTVSVGAGRSLLVSGVYRNKPRYEDRSHSPIHYGAVWLQVIDTPAQMLDGHYWTDRNTAGEMRLTERQKKKFQDFKFAQAHYAQLAPKATA